MSIFHSLLFFILKETRFHVFWQDSIFILSNFLLTFVIERYYVQIRIFCFSKLSDNYQSIVRTGLACTEFQSYSILNAIHSNIHQCYLFCIVTVVMLHLIHFLVMMWMLHCLLSVLWWIIYPSQSSCSSASKKLFHQRSCIITKPL